MTDEAAGRIGAMLEEMSARFELVVEAVSGVAPRLDTLKREIFAQFAEVGGQIRFLSEQIAENRRGISAARGDLGAEIARIGEALGRTRVEFREEISGPPAGKPRTAEHRDAASGISLGDFKHEMSVASETAAKKLSAELKRTNAALTNLARKFDRFDDRITVQTRDQDQRIRKLERKRSA